MKFSSLFTGIGGFDLGFESAGMQCVTQVEIDKNCVDLLEKQFPNSKRMFDVREYNGESVDLICGGFPCQDVSVAGKRAGLAGERSGLWFEFHRILENSRPRWVVIENVPGLLSSNGGRDFAVVLRGMEDIGYHAAWRVLDSQYFGVAQRRRRVFIVGSLGTYDCAKILFESESVSGDTAPGGTKRSEVTGETRNYTASDVSYWSGAQVTQTLTATGLSRRHASPHKGNFASVIVERSNVVMSTLDTHLGDKQWLENQSIKNFEIMRLAGAGIRRLTPTECERLQGFPDAWTEGFADTVRYKMLGNAVTVNVAEWIGKRITGQEE